MNIPQLPKAITRDDTEHGKLYYTRKQMIDFAVKAIELNAMPKHSGSKAVDDLSKIFGFAK